MYITKWWIDRYQATPGCEGCTGEKPAHTEECRRRFEGIVEANRQKGREDAKKREEMQAMSRSSMAAEASRAEAVPLTE
eukprot:4983700-Amphidinium_carterae.1